MSAKPQFLLDLERDGYVVVPSVIPKDACENFIASAWNWLESFPHGFDRNDLATWEAKHLPYGHDRGLYNRYSVNHEDFVWKIRTQPGILSTFAAIWGTEDLVASFDGMNVSLPVNAQSGRKDIGITKPWPHIDQNPRRVGMFELYQGIANMAPNGADDGGLVVLKGSHLLHEQHFQEIGGWREEGDSGVDENGYNFRIEDAEWYKAKGCEEVKICAGAGDLILWDSRTIHWNSAPTGEQTRFATYVCYCPRSWMSNEELRAKREVFEARKGTTHWPNMNIVPADKEGYFYARPRRPDDTPDLADRDRPFHEPEVTPAVLKLVGVQG